MAAHELLATEHRIPVLPAPVLIEVMKAVVDVQGDRRPSILSHVIHEEDNYELRVDDTASVLHVRCIAGAEAEFRATRAIIQLQEQLSRQKSLLVTTPIAKAVNDQDLNLSQRRKTIEANAKVEIQRLNKEIEAKTNERNEIRARPQFDGVYDLVAMRDCRAFAVVPLSQPPRTYLELEQETTPCEPPTDHEKTAASATRPEEENTTPLRHTSTGPKTDPSSKIGTTQDTSQPGSGGKEKPTSESGAPPKTSRQTSSAQAKAKKTTTKGRESKRKSSTTSRSKRTRTSKKKDDI